MKISNTGVLLSANSNYGDLGKVMVVGGTILLIIVLGYKVLKSMIQVIVEIIEKGINYIYRDEIEAEKARTEELLKHYEMETKKIEVQKDDVYTKIF